VFRDGDHGGVGKAEALPAVQVAVLVEQFADPPQFVVLDRDLPKLPGGHSIDDVGLGRGADPRRGHPADLCDHVRCHQKVIRAGIQQLAADLIGRISAVDRRHQRTSIDQDH
jgi:hypothetical protein